VKQSIYVANLRSIRYNKPYIFQSGLQGGLFMKKIIICALVFMVLMVPVFVAGSDKEAEPGKELPKIVCYLSGTLGDISFWDSAGRGMEWSMRDFEIQGKLIEGGYDPQPWEPDFIELSNQDWDVIVCGSWAMVEILEKVAPQHPEKKYIFFDSTVDYSTGKYDNVYSMVYKNNEEAFLPGALAAMVTSSNMPLANPEKIVAFNGNMDIPVLQDFLAGFKHGVRYVDPDVEVLVAWAGGFGDVAKTNENAMALADQGVDVIYNASTLAALIDVVREKNVYAIGVGSDAAAMFVDKDPVNSKRIIASDLKSVDKTIYRAIKLYLEGNLPFGTVESLGIKKGGVGLAKNEIYMEVVPEEFRKKIDELEQKVIDGEIVVDTVF
jgi:basic membrane protein A